MGVLRTVGNEIPRIFLPSLFLGVVGPSLLSLLSSIKYLQNYPINVKMDQLRMLPVTMGLDIHYLLRKTGYYWEHLLLFLATAYMLIVVSDFLLRGRRTGSLFTMGHQMFVCACIPTATLIIMKYLYFMNEDLAKVPSSYMRQLVQIIWHNVGIIAKMRLAMHALAFFKKLERGTLEMEILLLLVTPIVSSMIMPFLTFASLLLSPLNIAKLELDQWLYSNEKKGFNEQLVVVLFEWHDVTAINSYFDLNWLCFFGFLASLLWLCSSEKTYRSNDRTFSNVFSKNMLKLLCLIAPFLMKSALPKIHYMWVDSVVDRSGYLYWCIQIYLHLFALIARVRLLQHIFTSFRPQ